MDCIPLFSHLFPIGNPTLLAADYPNRALTLVIPWPAGGATDMLGRRLASEVEKNIGQQLVEVNKTGGRGAIGHTLMEAA